MPRFSSVHVEHGAEGDFSAGGKGTHTSLEMGPTPHHGAATVVLLVGGSSPPVPPHGSSPARLREQQLLSPTTLSWVKMRDHDSSTAIYRWDIQEKHSS